MSRYDLIHQRIDVLFTTLDSVPMRQAVDTLKRGFHALRRPRPALHPHPLMSHLGTPYGGWHFVSDDSLRRGTIISAGLGEDASFDVAMASIYDCRVIIVDPTPRAVEHFHGIQQRLGEDATRAYSAGGCQPHDAYNLSNIRAEQLVLVAKALAVSDVPVRLFAPPNPEHVSYSMTDYQNGRKKQGPFIETPATSYNEVVDLYLAGDAPPLVKLDIEGAELEVIPALLERPPAQILVEFDELNFPDTTAVRDWKLKDEILRDSQYVVAHTDGVNFTYVHKSLY